MASRRGPSRPKAAKSKAGRREEGIIGSKALSRSEVSILDSQDPPIYVKPGSSTSLQYHGERHKDNSGKVNGFNESDESTLKERLFVSPQMILRVYVRVGAAVTSFDVSGGDWEVMISDKILPRLE